MAPYNLAPLAGSLGFCVGLRAWGPDGTSHFEHVYAVVLLPADGDKDTAELPARGAPPEDDVYGLDTSADVGDSHPGWKPPGGHILTAWLDAKDD